MIDGVNDDRFRNERLEHGVEFEAGGHPSQYSFMLAGMEQNA